MLAREVLKKMMNLNQIQARIEATKSTKKITSALKLISASEYPKSLSKKKHFDEFFQEYQSFIKIIISQCPEIFKKYNQRLFNDKKQSNLIILFFSKRGLCGDFNKKIELQMHCIGVFDSGFQCDVIVIGKRGFSTIRALASGGTCQIKILREFSLDCNSEIDNIEAFFNANIVSFVNNYRKIFFVYNKFKSLFSCQATDVEVFSKLQKISGASKENNDSLINLLQDQEEIFRVFDKYIVYKALKALHNSLVSEVSSRFVTTDQASTNARKQIDKLQLKYNKLRQALITKEIAELCIASMEKEETW